MLEGYPTWIVDRTILTGHYFVNNQHRHRPLTIRGLDYVGAVRLIEIVKICIACKTSSALRLEIDYQSIFQQAPSICIRYVREHVNPIALRHIEIEDLGLGGASA